MSNEHVSSKNERAEQLLGLRPDNIISLDLPCEIGFHCPVCKYNQVMPDGEYDDRLNWSEYNGMIWCEVCNLDYPSALCMPDMVRATEIFLDTVRDAVAYDAGKPHTLTPEMFKRAIWTMRRRDPDDEESPTTER
jgi:uncharacterized protein YbaR (Trm112 family)